MNHHIAFINAANQAVLTTLLRHRRGPIRRLDLAKFIRAVELPGCPGTDRIQYFGAILEALCDGGLHRRAGGFDRLRSAIGI